ncbi:glycerate kinase [Tessaracoccus sp. MC1865]|uniref:glycerate kinase n=1 Tax=Tessaracoccus sp. MC1865 TaxID=2760310 RepID=UPI0016047428|nr:glycerate kinase [Tessaracoccus sp. MC1865]MBB1483919.1 glycerate kinase [Tessaracoccus sp. MC1865]QTO36970.1 glycerate kinase [Tessaracoccus sp. MC1865]
MLVVIAPDKFKGSLAAHEVVEAIAAGIRDVMGEGAEIVSLPVADGGEGTVEAAISAGYERRTATVRGPLGHGVNAHWALRDSEAVIEMAAASGLELIPAAERDGLRASSFGTGELVRAALDAGASTIVLGVGGSASTDGGAGMLEALGVRLLAADGSPVGPGGGPLADLALVDASGLDPRLAATRFVLANDVDNPLCGPRGAAAVFGPQKGLTPDAIPVIDDALGRWANLLGEAIGLPPGADLLPGAGAAGGVGFAALAGLGAESRPGAELVAELVGVPQALVGADLAITGEGSLDEQSLGGKAPMGVLAAARKVGVPAVIVCGRSLLDDDQWQQAGFTALYALTDRATSPEESMREAARLLREVGREIAMSMLTPLPQRKGHA